MEKYDIAVIGGGASGLAAAITAKREQPKLKIVILERLSRVGKKLLSTGNGRCNLTNRNLSPEFYSGSCKSLFPFVQDFSVDDFFLSLGVICKADEAGRVYPASGTAAAVLDSLRLETARLGIEVICDFTVSEVEKNGVFTIKSSGGGKLSAKAVILAGGGMSQPDLGSDGSVLKICRKLSIPVITPRPALVPVKTDGNLVRSLKGIRTEAKVSVTLDGKKVKSEYGEVQFGDGTLSGICIFNLSSVCSEYLNRTELQLDLLPDKSFPEICALIEGIAKIRSEASLEDLLSGIFNKRIGMAIIKQATKHSTAEPVKSLTAPDIKAIAGLIKSWKFPVYGTCGYEKSQVTAGGVSIEAISESLEAKGCPSLFLCGEILDINGDCGGYNLTFAFASGCIAGKNCADKLSV